MATVYIDLRWAYWAIHQHYPDIISDVQICVNLSQHFTYVRATAPDIKHLMMWDNR